MQGPCVRTRRGRSRRPPSAVAKLAETAGDARPAPCAGGRRGALRKRRPAVLPLIIGLVLAAALPAAAPAATHASVGAYADIATRLMERGSVVAAAAADETVSWTVTPSVAGGPAGHGTISPDTAQLVREGGDVTFTFTPDAGYVVDEVLVDGSAVTLATPTTYTFPPVHGDQTISVSFTPAGPGPEAGFGNALSFGQGYLRAPLSSSVAFSGASDFTIELWVRPDDVGAGFVNLARQHGAVGTLQTWFLLAPGNHICFGLDNYNNGGWYWSARDADPLPAGVWSHVAFVKDGDHGRIYVNGALILEEGFAGYACLTADASGAPFEFGADTFDADGNPLNGDLDEIQIYDRPLSGADLAAIYNRGPGQSLPLTPDTAPVRYYRLDESSGTAAADAGSDGVEAALTDMPSDSWIESYAGRDFLSAYGDAIPVGVAYGDVSTAALTVAVVDQPEHGDVDLTAPTLGQGTYTPDAGWSGFETFTYTVSDGTTTTPAQTAYVTAYTVDTHTWTGLGGDYRWSTAANWDLGVPTDGDSVIVGSSWDDIPTLRLKDVTLVGDASGYCSVNYPSLVSLTVTGTLDCTCLVGEWNVPTTIGPSTTLASAGTLYLSSEISGGDALGALTVEGPGAVSFTYWTANTYAGATHVASGVLTVKRGELPPGSPVSVASGATLQYLGDGMPDPYIDELGNAISGPAGAELKFSQIASVMLTGDSSSFGGATTVEASEDYGTSELSVSGALGGTLGGGGWIGGSGSVGALAPDAHLWVGFAGHWTGIGVSTLFTGPTELGDGGSYRWDLTDAEGTPGSGGDLLAVSGDLDVSALGAGYTVIPVTCSGGDFGQCAGFDPTKAYRWPIVTATGSISGFSGSDFTVDTSLFQNATERGTFSVAQGTHEGNSSLDLVFTPAPGMATWTGGGASRLWSAAGNWQGGAVPEDGDALVFPRSVPHTDPINDLLSSAASVDVYGGEYGTYFIRGGALTLHGELTLGSGTWWLVDKTTLGADVTVRQVPEPSGTTSPVTISGDIDLVDDAGEGHTLTVVPEDFRSVVCHSGRLTGSEEEGGLVVHGNPEGVLLLGHGPGLEPWDRRGDGWTGPNTWAGPTVLRNGSIWILSPGALSQHTSPVHIVDGPWYPTMLIASFPSAESTDTWGNTFSDDGVIDLRRGHVTFTGSSPAFAGTLRDGAQATLAAGAVLGGTADVVGGGTLHGLGTVGDLLVEDAGTLGPGLGEFGVGELTASGDVTWNGGGTYVVDVADADGGLAHDLLTIGGDAPGLTVASTEASPFTIALVSSDGTSAAPCDNFNRRRSYRWRVATLSSGGISGWTKPGAVQVDATRFAAENDVGDGVFSAEPSADGASVDVVFTPLAPQDQPHADFGNALAFGQGYLSAPSSPSIAFSGASDFTMEMWVWPSGVSADDGHTLVRQRGADDTLQSWLFLNKGNTLQWGFDKLGTGWHWSPVTEQKLAANHWSHLAWVKQGTEVKLYVNGREALSDSFAGAPAETAAASGAPLEFAGDSWEGIDFAGSVDEVMVYDRALSAAEVGSVYNRGPGQWLSLTPDTGPVRYYRLDESSGTTAADDGADGVAATLTGMSADPWGASYAGRDLLSAEGDAVPVGLAYGDADVEDLTVAVVDQPAHGTVDLTSPGLGQGTYTPDPGWTGVETFTYTVSDGTTTTPAQTAVVTALAVDTHTWTGLGGDSLWSTAANWDLGVPRDGDALVFPDGGTWDEESPPTNDLLSSVASASLSGGESSGFPVYGNALTLYGDLGLGSYSIWGVDKTTLGADVTIRHVPVPDVASNPAAVTGDIDLVDAEGSGHTLTVDASDGNAAVCHQGIISGAAGDGGLVKTGEWGSLVLGQGPGLDFWDWRGDGWTGPNTWAGPTDIRGGAVYLLSPGALSQNSPSVSLLNGPGSTTTLAAFFGSDVTTDTWGNTFTGNGTIAVMSGQVVLTGPSPAFTGTLNVGGRARVAADAVLGGTAQVANGGVLDGLGAMENLLVEYGGTLGPGLGEFGVGELTASGDATWGSAGVYAVDMKDAAGDAGTGYDLLTVGGASPGLTVDASAASPFKVVLRSSDGSRGAPCEGFDNTQPGRWQIVRLAGGDVSGWTEGSVTVDATQFKKYNHLPRGTFSVAVSRHPGATPSATVDLVFTPASTTPVAGFGNGLQFGTGRLEGPNSASVAFSGASDYTVEFWVRPSATATGPQSLFRQRSGRNNQLESWIYISSENRLWGGVENLPTGWEYVGHGLTLPSGVWSHVAMTKSGDALRLFVNGQQTDMITVSARIMEAGPTSAALTFGGDNREGFPLKGALDEIQVYGRALSGEELAATYNRGLGQTLTLDPPTGPLRYYQLDESSGKTAFDAGSDGVDANLLTLPASPWIPSTAGREVRSVGGTAGAVALAYGDPDLAEPTVAVVTQPAHGTVTLTSPSLGQGTYTPDVGWSGTETFTYQVSDDATTTAPVTATVTTTPPDTHTWKGGGGNELWSTAANWAEGVVPSAGDSLVFPGGATSLMSDNDLTGLEVHDVSITAGGYAFGGNGLVLDGDLSADLPASPPSGEWALPLTLGAGAHAFAVSAGTLRLNAALSGGAADQDVITKTGAGTLDLGGTAGYDGDVAVLEGVLDLTTPAAVPAAADVAIASGATLAVSFEERGAPATLGGTLSGPADARLELNGRATLVLAGDASGFAGTASVAGSGPDMGVLRIGDGVTFGGSLTGGGAISGEGNLAGFGDITTVFPGLAGWQSVGGATYPVLEVAALHSATTAWSPLTRLAVTMTDASGAAGTGYDQVQVDGDLTIPADGVVTVGPITSVAGGVGECAGFDQHTLYRWHVVRVSGAITGFDAATTSTPTGSFLNAHSGTFSLQQGTEEVGGTTYQTIDLVYAPPLAVGAPVVAGGAATLSVGTTQTVAWETNNPVGDGSFDVVAVDAASVETTIVAGVPADGTASYAAVWTVLQKAASGWRVKVVYRGAADVPSAPSAAFKVVDPALSVTTPATGSSWSRTTTRTVSWEASPALATGSFRVWATPAAGGTTRAVSTTVVPVVPGQAAYELPCRWTLPSGSWKLSVYYYAAGTTFTCQNAAKPVVTVPATWAIASSRGPGGAISPLGVTSVDAGADQSYTVTPAAGYHVRDVLVDGVSAGPVTAFAFVAVDRDHTIAASFEKDPGIVVTAPADGATWSLGTTETVSWTVSPSVAVGSFRVWATPAAGGTTRAVSTTVVPVVPGQAAYELPCRWTLPSGSWKLSVYYYAAGTTFTSQNAVKPTVTVPLAYAITASKGTGGSISPLGVTYVPAGADQTYSITPASGYHVRDVLVDGGSVGAAGTWQFTAVDRDHTIAAAFEKNPQISVSAPTDGSTWSRGTTETVSWTVSPPLSVGSFRVWATPAGGGTTRSVSATVVPAVIAQPTYSLDCRWALPAGDWKLSVYYYAGTTFTCQNPVKPVVHVP